MFNEAQTLYLEEVLGVSPKWYASQSASDRSDHAFLILTPPLGPSEKALLGKILESIQLRDYQHLEVSVPVETGKLPELAAMASPDHVLVFAHSDDISETARETHGESIWWRVPSLTAMSNGAAAKVSSLKKKTWTLLQQLNRERETRSTK